MSWKNTWCKFLAVLLVLVLLVPILAACGDDDEEETATPAITISDKPVKIGAITAWSGYGGIAGQLADPVIEMIMDVVNSGGGVRVGNSMRPLQIIKYDTGSTTSGAGTAATKALLQDKVTALAMGGLTGADGFAIADVAEPKNLPYFHYMGEKDLNDKYTCTINATFSMAANIEVPSKFIVEELKPKTAGYLSWNSPMDRAITEGIRSNLEKAGVKTVYSEYHNQDVTDYTPFLTKVKYEKPDILISYDSSAAYSAMFQQIPGLGGWGNMAFYGASQAAINQWSVGIPGIEGIYSSTYWVPGLQEAGPKKFGEMWASYAASHPDWAKRAGGSAPDTVHVPFYQCIMMAIKAIEFAGTDDGTAVLKAARSGNFTWDDSPLGPLRVDTNGYCGGKPIVATMKDKHAVFLKRY